MIYRSVNKINQSTNSAINVYALSKAPAYFNTGNSWILEKMATSQINTISKFHSSSHLWIYLDTIHKTKLSRRTFWKQRRQCKFPRDYSRRIYISTYTLTYWIINFLLIKFFGEERFRCVDHNKTMASQTKFSSETEPSFGSILSNFYVCCYIHINLHGTITRWMNFMIHYINSKSKIIINKKITVSRQTQLRFKQEENKCILKTYIMCIFILKVHEDLRTYFLLRCLDSPSFSHSKSFTWLLNYKQANNITKLPRDRHLYFVTKTLNIVYTVLSRRLI